MFVLVHSQMSEVRVPEFSFGAIVSMRLWQVDMLSPLSQSR